MAPASEKILTIAALGRPFRLGMLYDCRTEKLIPGITLWDKSTLEEKVVQQLETSDFQIIASDSLDSKTSALDINANLKLSFLGGLLEVSGSAKYLENRKSSSLQERVTLQYKCTTKSEEMTMEQLGYGRVQHPKVFDHGTATHVVTGIEYGGQAFFVFDRQYSSSSNCREVDGDLQVMVKSLPTIQIDGNGKVDLSEDEKKRTENFSCIFYGDFLLRENPSSYQDAVRIYKDIPKLLGEQGQNAVPVKIKLYPLILLDTKASKLVREVSTNLISEIEKILEDLHEFSVKCNDLCNSHAVKKFLTIQKDIMEFKSLIATYKCGLQKELSGILPLIRGGGVEESCLLNILRKKEASPFSFHNLQAWLQDKEKHVKILNEYTKALSEVKFASQPGDLESTVMSPESDYTICFTILMPKTNLHLQRMEKYNRDECDTQKDSECPWREEKGQHQGNALKDSSSDGKHQTVVAHNPSTLCTHNRTDKISMMEKAILFKNFFGANKDRTGTAFIIGEESSSLEDFQACIRCYKHGRLVNENYELPSAPGMPQVAAEESTHESITIYWTPPESGASNVQKYEIFCRENHQNNNPVKFIANDVSCRFTIPNLNANCKYQVKVQSWCEAGLGPASDTNSAVITRPTSPPGKPQVWQTSSTSVQVRWSKPVCIGAGCTIRNYIIKQQEEKTNRWTEIGRTNSDEHVFTVNTLANITPKFKVAAYCGVAGYSMDSDSSDHMSKIADRKGKQYENRKIMKEKLCAASLLMHEGKPCIYLLQPKLVICRDSDRIRKYDLGVPDSCTHEKVILLVGATGSGKTTFINTLVNYIFGVNWKDAFRFKLIMEAKEGNQSKSQTKFITSYTIYHQGSYKFPYTLTIIDTPGFGDTSGVMRDREIVQQIRAFFMTSGVGGIDHIDAVGFVAQSSLPRLTPTQRYIFDQILSLFGSDIADNIFLLLTFADGQPPQVLSGIKESGMPYRKHFKFNNSAVYADNSLTDEDLVPDPDSDDEHGKDNFDEMFWQMGVKSFSVFLKQLDTVDSKSLTMTQDVLNERHQLQVYITGIRGEILVGLNTLENLQKEVQIVKNHQSDIEKNKNFKYTVEEEIYVPVPIPNGQYITNCQQCNRTCHEICQIRDDDKKFNCWAITNELCRICPDSCHWSVHKNFPFKYVPQVNTVTKTSKELFERYKEATEKKISTENLIFKIQDEFKAVKLKVLGMTESVRKSLERLQAIALKPNPLSTVEYIDILISSEQSQAQPGWSARVEQLKIVKSEAEYMQKVADQGFDPFEEYKTKLDLEMKSNKKSFWAAAGKYLSKIFS